MFLFKSGNQVYVFHKIRYHKFISMRCPFSHMTILISSIGYEQKMSYSIPKVSKIQENTILAILISLFNYFMIYIFFFLLPLLGLTNPTPLNRNLVLEICKERVYTHIISTHIRKQNLSMMHTSLARHGVD
jgi:hypothetical protein